ncbi:MAG: heme-binding domain-containing protein [Planctomycetes bacterium]|nr:heme-binding domain-containing protein [Planctomycetota bacterium]MCB9935727.1 heme-binding domain-containing protein [Planctomycetota bacterium]
MAEQKKKRRILKPLLLSAVALAAAIQLVPYGRDHSNPPVTAEPQWDSTATRDLAKRACFDCHSNETVWPWYSHVAPVSWLLQRDVDEGRSKLNFSEWDKPQKEADEAAKEVREGEMPPWFYLPTHPEARLTDAEKQALIAGLEATVGAKSEGHGED